MNGSARVEQRLSLRFSHSICRKHAGTQRTKTLDMIYRPGFMTDTAPVYGVIICRIKAVAFDQEVIQRSRLQQRQSIAHCPLGVKCGTLVRSVAAKLYRVTEDVHRYVCIHIRQAKESSGSC